jgi:hypothetical protein
MLRLVFALRPPHLEEEEQFLSQLQDRDSPLFHKYLSEQEWNQRFAPSAEDEQAVVAWARSQGLSITQRYPNRLLVDVEAPVAIIEKALDVAINRYQVSSASYYSNDRDPLLPAELVSVVHAVRGLNNIEVAHTFSKGSQSFTGPDYSPGPAYAVGSHLVSDAKKPRAAMSGRVKRPDNYENPYWPSELWAAGAYNYGYMTVRNYTGYGLNNLQHCCNPLNNPNNSPPEASIAIAIWGDFLDSDLQSFRGDIASNVQRYFVDGTPQCCSEETTVDVDWATAMANSFDTSADTAEIHVYEGTNGQMSTLVDVLNRISTDGHARVLSMSWGGAEIYQNPASAMDTFHAIFNQMSGQGWTLVAASGDGGATTDCADHLSVSYPASDPDVTAAGGTTLVITPGDDRFVSETGWTGGSDGCSNNDGGSGGGCSAYYAAPGYQSRPACGPHSRSLPDLALNADGLNTPQVVIDQSWVYPAGGTSIVAPELAGLYAQANAYLLYIGSIVGNTCGPSYSAPCAPVGNANPSLYAEGYEPFAPHYPFYDITSGCDNNDITQRYGLSYFCAGPGYDMVTGWGSANMLQLSWMINAFVAGDGAGPVTTFSGPQPNRWYPPPQVVSWAIADTSANGHSPNGVAGYSVGLNADPGDPYSEPTPSPNDYWHEHNSFYVGPNYANSSNGTWSLGEGCQTLFVRAWDNAGQATISSTGPLCLDTYPPITHATLTGNLQGQSYSGPVLVTLTASDSDSGVANTVYINGGTWRSYTGPFYVTVPGTYIVAFYSTDNVGNVENTEYSDFTIANNWQYLVSVSMSGTGTGTVTSADGYINCGSTCSSKYYDESQVTLTAEPAPGSVFTGWSGCDLSLGFSCNIAVTSDRSATAIFNTPVPLQFVPVTPCRLLDTRPQHGGNGPIQGGTAQSFNLPQLAQAKGCSDLSSAAVYSLNTTVIPSGTLGYLTVWPDGLTRPQTSALNSPDGRVKANAAIVPGGTGGAVDVYATDTTDVVLDIDGYFAPASSSTLQFYPLTPCRVADTRQSGFPMGLGTPHLSAGVPRDFPILASNCAIPSTAKAYSLNFTAIPSPGLGYPLGYLELWPKDQMPQNPVSTLNNVTGTIVANAAIVPAGTNGQITAYANNDTELVIDVNGYFAPGPGGMSLYSSAPCRAVDTRKVGTGQPFSGELSPPIGVANGPCAPSAQAQAYVFNATVVPTGPLGYLTLWPDGEGQPVVSTLNAFDGAITNNMAIVPTNNGSIDAYANGLTQLVLDISSYFAP